jgi:hypothetical protein
MSIVVEVCVSLVTVGLLMAGILNLTPFLEK